TACPVRSFQMPPARREARPGAICAPGCQAPAANVQTGSSWQRCFCRTGAIFFAGAPARKKFLENRRRAAPHACVCVTNNLQTELETDLHAPRGCNPVFQQSSNRPSPGKFHERMDRLRARTLLVPLPETECAFCAHRKCQRCREVSFSSAACCQCRNRAIERLKFLRE